MGKHIKILVVEDELIVAADIKRQLMNDSNRTVLDLVSKGEKAIEVAITERPDVILMDIVLGTKMNGLEAAREILSIYKPVIIFVSGYIDDKISNEIDSFMAFKLRKPYKIKEVNAIIEAVFPSPSRGS
jgi:CheY-like chemotaxis protein